MKSIQVQSVTESNRLCTKRERERERERERGEKWKNIKMKEITGYNRFGIKSL